MVRKRYAARGGALGAREHGAPLVPSGFPPSADGELDPEMTSQIAARVGYIPGRAWRARRLHALLIEQAAQPRAARPDRELGGDGHLDAARDREAAASAEPGDVEPQDVRPGGVEPGYLELSTVIESLSLPDYLAICGARVALTLTSSPNLAPRLYLATCGARAHRPGAFASKASSPTVTRPTTPSPPP